MSSTYVASPRPIHLIAACAVALCATSDVVAHDVWLTVARKGELFGAQLHNGDTDKRELADRNRIVTLELINGAGSTDLRRPIAPGQVSGQPMLETRSFASTGPAVLAVSYDNGFWINHPQTDAEINTTKLVIPDGKSAHWTIKFGKALLGPGAFERVTNQRLELVPLRDPYKLALGEKLPVRLQLNGKPIAGVQIAYSDGTTAVADDARSTVTTANDGTVEIPVQRKGTYLLSADCEVAPMYPALSERDHLYASLSFDTSP